MNPVTRRVVLLISLGLSGLLCSDAALRADEPMQPVSAQGAAKPSTSVQPVAQAKPQWRYFGAAQQRDQETAVSGQFGGSRRFPQPKRGLRAGEEIKFGNLKLHPYFNSRVEYDDNIRLSRSDPKDDVVFTQTPFLNAELQVGDHKIEGGYGVEIIQFAKEQEENATNHMAQATVQLNFNDLLIRAADKMEMFTDRLLDETSARAKVFTNTVEVSAIYDRPQWTGELGWAHDTVDYRTDIFQNLDYGEDVIVALAGYKVQPQLLVFTEVDWGFVNYDRNVTQGDHTYWRLWEGVRTVPTENTTFNAKFGVENRYFSDLPTAASAQQRQVRNWVADIDGSWRLSDRDIARAGYLRAVVPSNFGQNFTFRQDRWFLSYERRIARKWITTFLGSYQHRSYPNDATVQGDTTRRDDNFWQATAELRYEIQRWLSAAVGYRFRSRDSDLNALDYDNNRYYAEVTVAF